MTKNRALDKARRLLGLGYKAPLSEIANRIVITQGTPLPNWRKGEILQFIKDYVRHSHKPKPKLTTLNIRKGSGSKDFYKSGAWRAIRYLALKLAHGRCQCCGACAHDNLQIHVDHIKPRSAYPELSLAIDNLQVLCEDCNIGKSDWDATDWRFPIAFSACVKMN